MEAVDADGLCFALLHCEEGFGLDPYGEPSTPREDLHR